MLSSSLYSAEPVKLSAPLVGGGGASASAYSVALLSSSTATTKADATKRAEESATEYKEVFAYFDRDRDGKMTAAEFGDAIRALGHAPTDFELKMLSSVIGSVFGGVLTFNNFVKVISTVVYSNIKHPSDTAPEMLRALSTFIIDCRKRSDGRLTASDLEMMMTRYGDRLDSKTFERFLSYETQMLLSMSGLRGAVDLETTAQLTRLGELIEQSSFEEAEGGGGEASAETLARLEDLKRTLLLPAPDLVDVLIEAARRANA